MCSRSNRVGADIERDTKERFRVVIAGGGIAGLEALLALSDLGGSLVDVELLSPADEFVYRPMLVAEPFGRAEALRLDLGAVAAEAGARHLLDSLELVAPAARAVMTAGGCCSDMTPCWLRWAPGRWRRCRER